MAPASTSDFEHIVGDQETKFPGSLLGYNLHLLEKFQFLCPTPSIVLREDHDGHDLLGEQDGGGPEEGGLVGCKAEHLTRKA